jgi:hypothetical protein
MDTWIEERCEAIRLALRIADFPQEGDLLRLVDWMGKNVRLRHADVEGGRCVYWSNGAASVTLPQQMHGKPYTWELSHEIGHVLLTVGMASLLRQMDPESVRVERLAQRWEAQDERRAQDFVLAWWMPSRLVREFDDYELAFHANVSVEMAVRRRQRLGGQVIELTAGLPRWSAAQHYHAVVSAGTCRAVLQVLRRGSLQPLFDFPTTQAACEVDALQVNADLVALTIPEFDLKYSDFRICASEPRPIDLLQLQRWAQRKAG